MSDIEKTPDCAEDIACIAACVLRNLLALAHSIKLAHSAHLSSQVPNLAELAIDHAEHWIEHFDEQGEMHRALCKESAGGKA